MSFITKRERVFNEYDLFDLPTRNEGKLKTYASCTDARAWSHFCSDKTEHLMEIIKRNNESCRPRYLPTAVLVDTLMVAKNAEIARLKHKIEEFEQLLATYDQLDLTCAQKCEIASAHAAIREANKELEEMCLDLDLSGFTEGIDSDAFETGKSRGDQCDCKKSESKKSRGDDCCIEKKTPKMEAKSNQTNVSCRCDVSTSVHDPRIQEMQDSIISKDAKLCAMQNTIAVMENDICEPYCIYAHIYTALEKIFGVLCQNDKYKSYLNLMIAGKDTQSVDIKGKILFKLKILEKFSLALIAPCSQETMESSCDCACLRAEVIARLDFPPLAAEREPYLNSKRAHLVADIMENEEMKDILEKDCTSDKNGDDQTEDEFGIETYSIDTENLKRLKNLQENYHDLMTCYENLKHEKETLQTKCCKYGELQIELDNLKSQLREYNLLWTEKEHYQRRSEHIDSLKEKYLILVDETSNLETQLKAESEISNLKSITIEELRSENIALQKKINEMVILFEKERNSLQCKLKETECTVMCQDQQIKSLSIQITKLLDQSQDKMEQQADSPHNLILIDEIESLKEQIKNLKDLLFCSEEEKQNLQYNFEEKLKNVNDLRMEIEDWKSSYEKIVQRNEYLEKYTDNVQDEVNKLILKNRALLQDVENKTVALENLVDDLNSKSREMKQKDEENQKLYSQLQELRKTYEQDMSIVENEKHKVFESLQLARQESEELLAKVKDYDHVLNQNDTMSKILETKSKEYNEMERILKTTIDQNKNLQNDIISSENNNSILLQELQNLREVNSFAIDDISDLQNKQKEYKISLELTRKKSECLENKLLEFETLTRETNSLKESYNILINEKNELQNELQSKRHDLDKTLKLLQSCKIKNEELIHELHDSRNEEIIHLSKVHSEILNEKHALEIELSGKSKSFENLLKSLNEKNDYLLKSSQQVSVLENELIVLKKSYNELLLENKNLQKDFDSKAKEINNLYYTLEGQIKENTNLLEKIKILELNQKTTSDNILLLQNENLISQTNLTAIQKESDALIDKLKLYENLEHEYQRLKNENQSIQNELNSLLTRFKEMQQENLNLTNQNRNLQEINEDLETSLMNTRSQVLSKSDNSTIFYEDIKKELNDMTKETLRNQNKIKDLLIKLGESETIVTKLNEDILSRDNKITLLENHVNHLEDEIRKLHNNLADVINASESIRDNSFIQMDQSMKLMEANHSRAAHNIKLEVIKLQTINSKLEEQLSATKLVTEESNRDKNKYLSHMVQLQNEKEIIINAVKKLELKIVGHSDLNPDQYRIDDILISLDRISKSMDVKNSKSISLEQTILKVQTSSQLLLTKADEAKKLVEKEKQKIITEKEDAIKDRLNMEKKVEELKYKLDKQINIDAKTIKELEANILNEKLLNEHTMSKLEKELKDLRHTNQHSTVLLNDLQEKVCQLTKENEKYSKENERLIKDLEFETRDKESLQNKIEDFCNKAVRNIEIQTYAESNNKNISLQTEGLEYHKYDNSGRYSKLDITNDNNDNCIYKRKIENSSVSDENAKINEPIRNKNISNLFSNQTFKSVNEVQILNANIEPTFGFVRNNYLNYKIQRLSPGRLEQYSIPNLEVPESISQIERNGVPEVTTSNTNIIDVYSLSSKVDNDDACDSLINLNQQIPINFSTCSEFDFSECIESKSKNESIEHNFCQQTVNSQDPVDAELILIYKESEINCKQDNLDQIIPLTIDEGKLVRPNLNKQSNEEKKSKKNIADRLNSQQIVKEEKGDNIKAKLNINIPRVNNESHTILAIPERDKNLDSYTLHIHPTQRQSSFTNMTIDKNLEVQNLKQNTSSCSFSNYENQYLRSSIEFNSDEDVDFLQNLNNKKIQQTDKKIKILRNEIVNNTSDSNTTHKYNMEDISHHSLSRVEADLYLVKSTSNLYDLPEKITSGIKNPKNIALNSLINNTQCDESIEYVNILRKAKSAEKFDSKKTSIETQHSSLKLSPFEQNPKAGPIRSFDIKSDATHTKSSAELSFMSKMENMYNYKLKIKYLTKTLKNTETDYKKKLDAIKMQYDMNIKNILTEHNLGVKNIQGLHEETLQEIIRIHENEIENLRTIGIEANRRAEKLEKENQSLKSKIDLSTTELEEEPIRIASNIKKCRRSRKDTKTLSKTNIEAFNVKPRIKSNGPCSCLLDTNVSDTIRNILEQVDVNQRKTAEHTYIKYIANKMLDLNVEGLDAQELSFLHLMVCQKLKTKLTKEENIKKRIDSLKNEVIHKQRNAQQHIAELDRRVAEERQRLHEVREAVLRDTTVSRIESPDREITLAPPPIPPSREKKLVCNCSTGVAKIELKSRRSAGDLAPGASTGGQRQRRIHTENNRAVLAKMDVGEKREKKLYNDEPPTRLRRSHDRTAFRRKK